MLRLDAGSGRRFGWAEREEKRGKCVAGGRNGIGARIFGQDAQVAPTAANQLFRVGQGKNPQFVHSMADFTDALYPARCSRTFNGHAGPVNAAIFDETGAYFVSASSDKALILWNTATGNLIQKFEAHGWEVYAVDISSGRKHVASGGADRPVFLWDGATARVVRKFHGHLHRVNAVCFNDDGSVLASGSYDKTVRVWDIRSSSRLPLQVLEHAKDSVESIDINKTVIVTASVDGCTRQYDIRKGKLTEDYLGVPVTSVQLSTDNACTLTSTLDNTLRLLDAETGRELVAFTGHRNEKYRSRSGMSSTEASVAAGSEDGSILVWDIISAKERVCLKGHIGPVNAVEWHPSSIVLLSCSMDATVKMWEPLQMLV